MMAGAQRSNINAMERTIVVFETWYSTQLLEHATICRCKVGDTVARRKS